MSSINVKKLSKSVKECKTNENSCYILQGRMFHNILTNKILNDKLTFQSHFKRHDYATDNHNNLPDCIIKDKNAQAGCVCWISQDDRYVKVYKIKDF